MNQLASSHRPVALEPALLSSDRRGNRNGLARPALLATIVCFALALRLAGADGGAPFPRPETLVGVGPVYPQLSQPLRFWEALSPAEYLDIRERSASLERVVAWDMGHRRVTGGQSPERVFAAFWWGDPLATLEVEPVAGRSFTVEETTQGARVAMISDRLWRRQFGADAAVVGKTIGVGAVGAPEERFVVVGVMPPGALIYDTDLWLPMWARPEQFQRATRQIQVLARLRPGSSVEQVNAELLHLAKSIADEHLAENPEYAGWRLEARTWETIEREFSRGR